MAAKLRDGIVKRGEAWSYVVRVTDADSGRNRPKWVGGFPTRTPRKRLGTSPESPPGAVSTSIARR